MVLVFLADGFEEIEALTVLDVLRRASIPVQSVGIASNQVKGSHGIEVFTDVIWSDVNASDDVDMIVLPGGMPGTKNLKAYEPLMTYIEKSYKRGVYVAAICAAPSILDHLGLLTGKRYTCYPGFDSKDSSAIYLSSESVVHDQQLITGKGMGVSLAFSLKLVEILKGNVAQEQLKASLMCES